MESPEVFELSAMGSAEGNGDAIAERILSAARHEFELIGVRRSNMIDIARRAGVSRATLYRRFRDRDSLVQVVAAQEVMAALTRIDAEVAEVDDGQEALVRMGVVGLRELREHGILNRMLKTEPEELYRYAAGSGGIVLTTCRHFVCQRLEQLQNSGGLPPGDLAPAAELLVRLSISLVLTPEGVIPYDDDDRVADFFRQYLLPLLTGEARRPAP